MNTTTDNAHDWPEMIVEIHETPPPIANIYLQAPRRGPRVGSRALICVAIVALHLGVALLFMRNEIDLGARGAPAVALIVQFLEPQTPDVPALVQFSQPMPIELASPVLPEMVDDPRPALRSLEPPRIDPTSRLDLAQYSARAQLPHGQIATVLIVLDIAADGTVDDAQVVRSTGNQAANAAALDYARATRWIPGNVAGEPRPMKASLTVILGENP